MYQFTAVARIEVEADQVDYYAEVIQNVIEAALWGVLDVSVQAESYDECAPYR